MNLSPFLLIFFFLKSYIVANMIVTESLYNR